VKRLLEVLLHCFLILSGSILPLLLYEVYLRSVDYRPLSVRTRASIFRTPHVYENDKVLGWRLVPGEFLFEGVSPGARQTRARVLLAGNRATFSEEFVTTSNPKGKIIFLGDSFTFGHGLNDEETYPWLVQQKLAEYTVKNFAVPGYGACQVYLELLELLQSGELNGATIIYGMSEFHETRNIPDRRTAWQFAAISTTKTYKAPGCFLDSEGQVVNSPARPYFDPLPQLTENFSVGRRFVHFFYSILDRSTASLRRPLSFALLNKINEISLQHGQSFVVLLQRFQPKAQNEYEIFLQKNGIRFIDGSHPKQWAPEMQLAGDGHPNVAMNLYWGELVARFISARS
jgi:hypothetical protein